MRSPFSSYATIWTTVWFRDFRTTARGVPDRRRRSLRR
jgi:hypothetical protein